MKFSLKRDIFLKGLIVCNKSLLAKANLPILSNLYISATKNGVEIVSTNLESATRVFLDAVVDVEGEITVLGRTLGEFVGQISGEDVVFEKLGEEAVVESGKFNARISTTDASEFPAIPKVENGIEIKVRAQELLKGIEQVVFCAAQDESRPILTGVLCTFSKGKIVLVATDGYRLGHSDISIEGKDEGLVAFIVPAKSLVEVAKIISDGDLGVDKEVVLVVAGNTSQILFKIGRVEFVSRLIEGEFPNWQKIIPTEFTTSAKVEKGELLKTVKAAAIFARESGNIVRLVLSGGKGTSGSITVSATTSQVGSANASVGAEVSGRGGEIAFNFRYLVDVLGVIESETVNFEMNESLNPGKITGEKDNKSMFHIIMPVRLQG